MSLFQLSTVFLPTTFLICAITVNHERSLKILCIPHFDVETAWNETQNCLQISQVDVFIWAKSLKQDKIFVCYKSLFFF